MLQIFIFQPQHFWKNGCRANWQTSLQYKSGNALRLMIHICFLTNEFPKSGFPHGGIGSFVKTLGTHLVQRGICVSVIGINYTDNCEASIEEGIHVYRLRKVTVKGLTWWLNQAALRKKILEVHQQHPINIVETSELGLAFINKIGNIKYVVRLHGGHHFFSEAENRKPGIWKSFQERRSFSKADAFIAVSEYVKSHTEKYLSYNNKKVARISNPVDTELFKPIPTAIVPQSIVFVGTVCEKKGIRQLIQAFTAVKKAYPSALLKIYGRDWYYPDGSSYIAMLREKVLPTLGPIADDVHFMGNVSHTDLPMHYASAAVCVFPSHMETQGLVAPEAMLMEKVVVFTELGPGPEAIAHGRTGLLCNPHSPEDIADKIIWVFDNKEKSEKIAKQGRISALDKYSPNQIISSNIAFYEELLVTTTHKT